MGFGPAGEDFLNDLMNIQDITSVTSTKPALKPKALDFGSDEEERRLLESVPEEQVEQEGVRKPQEDGENKENVVPVSAVDVNVAATVTGIVCNNQENLSLW